jgi:hypothetical protein
LSTGCLEWTSDTFTQIKRRSDVPQALRSHCAACPGEPADLRLHAPQFEATSAFRTMRAEPPVPHGLRMRPKLTLLCANQQRSVSARCSEFNDARVDPGGHAGRDDPIDVR